MCILHCSYHRMPVAGGLQQFHHFLMSFYCSPHNSAQFYQTEFSHLLQAGLCKKETYKTNHLLVIEPLLANYPQACFHKNRLEHAFTHVVTITQSHLTLVTVAVFLPLQLTDAAGEKKHLLAYSFN